MSATLIFPCGHSYSTVNIRSVTSLRCATCAREAMAKRAKTNRKKTKAKRTNLSTYDGRVHAPLVGADCAALRRNVERGSQLLLKALYREHPGVFHAAAKAGRLVVIP